MKTAFTNHIPQKLIKCWPTKRLYPDEFRKLLAWHGDRYGLPAEFFRPAHPGAVCVVGGRGWVGVLGTGTHYVDLVQNAVPAVLQILERHTGLPSRVQLSDHEKRATPAPGQTYRIIRFVCRVRDLRAPPEERLLPALIRKRVLRDLYSQSGWRYIDDDTILLDRQAPWGVFDLPKVEVDILEIRRPRGIEIKGGEMATLVEVEIGLNLKLDGIWQFGALKARGFGRVTPTTQVFVALE